MCARLASLSHQSLKSKVGLSAAKAAALMINLNVEGCGIVAAPVHAPSRAPLLLPLLLYGVRTGPGEARARTILLLHIISVRPSKQPLMVRTFLKVYMELGSYFLVSARTNKRHHHHHTISLSPAFTSA
jgi:hypothetical protein